MELDYLVNRFLAAEAAVSSEEVYFSAIEKEKEEEKEGGID